MNWPNPNKAEEILVFTSGAIIFRCGDSRNGSAEKALKEVSGRPPEERVKTIALAGGAHADELTKKLALRQVEIYTDALLTRGATKIYVVITDHEDCAYVDKYGKKNIVARWTKKKFLRKLFAINPAIKKLSVMTIGYESCSKPVVPSSEVKLSLLHSVKRTCVMGE